MIFKQWQEIIDGKKTVTRQLVQPGERFISRYMGTRKPVEANIYKVSQGYPNGKIKWQVGRSYAIQPGRGKPALMVNYNHPCNGVDIWEAKPEEYAIALSQGYQEARIEVVSLRGERLWDITDSDICLELGDPVAWPGPGPEPYPRQLRTVYVSTWNQTHIKPGERWQDNPEVWRIEFRLKKS